jgi:hypothetical protein
MDSQEIDIAREFARFCYTVKKNYLLAFFLPVLGTLAAIGWYSKKESYVSKMLLETSLLNESEADFLLNEFKKADSLPGLQSGHQGMIRSLTFTVFEKEVGPKTVGEDKTTYITADLSVSDTSVFQPLQKAILVFLTSNPSFKRNKSERDRYYNAIINRIDTEIAELQNAKKDISAKSSNSILNPADLYSTAVDLEKMRSEYSLKKQSLNALNVVKDFRALQSQSVPSIIIVGLIGFALGVLLFLAILAIKAFIKFYTRFEKEFA